MPQMRMLIMYGHRRAGGLRCLAGGNQRLIDTVMNQLDQMNQPSGCYENVMIQAFHESTVQK